MLAHVITYYAHIILCLNVFCWCFPDLMVTSYNAHQYQYAIKWSGLRFPHTNIELPDGSKLFCHLISPCATQCRYAREGFMMFLFRRISMTDGCKIYFFPFYDIKLAQKSFIPIYNESQSRHKPATLLAYHGG